MSPLPAGSLLDERYRIDELLSVGGMGAVYAGHHVNLAKRVAIKVLRKDVRGVNLLDRFRREAQAASAIGHENIVQVTDMGTAPDGTAYLVMELLEGASLGELLRTEAPMSVGRACRIACEILRGVEAAHGAGIIHRDIKPDNVFLARAGGRETVKLLDFGVSLLERLDVPDARLTSTGALLGTPRYMAPEQARGQQDVTTAVDLYAVGVVLYEMLTGKLPYSGENYNLVIYEIIAGDWVPIEKHRPDLPAEIVAAVQRALALQPADRFASAGEMRAFLEPFASDTVEMMAAALPRPEHSPVALAPTEVSTPDAAAAGARGETREQTAPVDARRGRGGLALGLGLLLVAAAAVATYVAVRERRGAEPSARAPARTDRSPAPMATPAPSRPPPAARVTDRPAARRQAPARADEPGARDDDRDERDQPSEPAPLSRSAVEPPAAPRLEGEVIILLTTVPAEARVTVEGTPLVGRRLAITRDTTAIEMQVQAPGHAPRTVEVVPDRDRTLEIKLRPLSPGEAPVAVEPVDHDR
ncbi:MAG TPA: serine/threonine-protein kinase [Kofleriaceae bacterium]|nr:serine/threonine-protein kinase [Kofleriaceae bacterium]